MRQVITQPRSDDTPGPGTLGAQRRAAERAEEEATRGPVLGDAWWLVALVFAVALAIVLGWLLGTRAGGVGEVMAGGAEAATIADEKVAMLAGGTTVDSASAADEVATQQEEKSQLLAGGSDQVRSVSRDAVTLEDEKAELTARRGEPAEVAAPPPSMTEQAEKETLLAG